MAVTTGVVAVVPTYQPPPDTIALVAKLSRQITTIIVSDDASPCTSDHVLADIGRIPHATVIRHATNKGIARGLNDGLHIAQESGARWLLTVDQDSNLAADYIADLVEEAELRTSSGEPLGAIGARTIADAAGNLTYPESGAPGRLTTEELIQTGTLWSVTALAEITGFDQSLGIDAVDAAACLAMRASGLTLGISDYLSVHHHIGSGRMVTLGNRTFMVTAHSPERRRSMLRNRLRLFPAEFRESPTHAIRTLRRVAMNQGAGLILESNRIPKLMGSLRGLLLHRDR